MSHKSAPLISIIVAVFNGAKTLQQCIASVAQQTYPNKELIIIDGGSKDRTVDLLEANREQISYWISEPDKGIYNAWNKGLSQTNGDWVCFLGADDYLWEPAALTNMAKHLDALPGSIRLVYGNVVLLDQNNQKLFTIGQPWHQVKTRFSQLMSIPHPGMMHKKSLFTEHGNFDETFRIAGDYEFLLRELKSTDAFFAEDVVIAGMQQGGISNNPKNTIKQLFEVRYAQKLHGYPRPGNQWLIAVFRAYLRMICWRLLGENITRKLMDFGRAIMGKPRFWTKT